MPQWRLFLQSLLKVALSWFDQGIIPIPLRKRDKPACIRWTKWRDNPPARKAIVDWFYSRQVNIGVLCGACSRNLAVVDFDYPLPYLKWKSKNANLCNTYTVETSRGYHLYYFIDNIPQRSLGFVGGELKASGYVVAAPSIHPTGWVYKGNDAPIMRLSDIGALHLPSLEIEPMRQSLPHPYEAAHLSGDSLCCAIKAELPITVFLSKMCKTDLYPPTHGDADFLMAVCPFHDDHNPSMWVNVKTMTCGCFSPQCKAHRSLDVIDALALWRWGWVDGETSRKAIFELQADLGL